ncbi:hypothetical protein OHR68_19670 [Spirillospora sp. NBC_00431]
MAVRPSAADIHARSTSSSTPAARPAPPWALRHDSGPLYARYGSFTLVNGTDEHDEPLRPRRCPDGRLVEESHAPVFHPPDWCRFGTFPRAAAGPVGRVPVPDPTGTDPIGNAGGTHLAADRRTGARVVLRERVRTRAWTPADNALTRLDRDRAALERAAGLQCVPTCSPTVPSAATGS